MTVRQILLALATLSTLIPADAVAQSLHGSRASIARMYRGARAEGLRFYGTPAAVRGAVRGGRLVRLASTHGVGVSDDVSFPYVRPQTRTFVQRLGVQYRAACGDRLVVTSGVRPATRQPANSSARSVHPTGMAVDLRKPEGRRCLGWLRRTLLELEDAGVIEATEERDPAHFHVAVFLSRYRRYVEARNPVQLAGASRAAASSVRYRVRHGDTLSEIAQEHDVPMRTLIDANDLAGDDIVAGQVLVIPQQ